MNKDTFRGLIAGILIMGLFFTGVPVSADTTDTFSNRLITAVNALKGSVDASTTKVTNVETAIKNQSNVIATAIDNISPSSSGGAGTDCFIESVTIGHYTGNAPTQSETRHIYTATKDTILWFDGGMINWSYYNGSNVQAHSNLTTTGYIRIGLEYYINAASTYANGVIANKTIGGSSISSRTLYIDNGHIRITDVYIFLKAGDSLDTTAIVNSSKSYISDLVYLIMPLK